MKRIVILAAAALMITGAASVANADHDHHDRRGRRNNTSFALQIGGLGISVGSPRYSSRYNNPRYNYGNRGLNVRYDSGYNRGISRYQSTRRDNARCDFNGPRVVRHGNHYDYIPGQYDRYRSGRWDSYRH